jgi:HEPN domain-containing protein
MPTFPRTEWRRLASERLAEARVLLRVGRSSGAFYIGGYVVECGLKAVIARQFRAGRWPDKKLVEKIHTHDPQTLVDAAGLKPEFGMMCADEPDFEDNWKTVLLWRAETRYATKSHAEARDLLRAISAPRNGVLTWIRRHW